MAASGSGGGVRLTGAGKFLLFLVGLAVLAYAGWSYRNSLPFSLPFGASETADSEPSSDPATSTSPATPGDSSGTRRGVLAAIRESGELRVGMEAEAPPLHFLNERRQEDGFDFRLAGVVAEAIGASRIRVVEADYEDLPDLLRQGDIDIIMAGYVPDPSIGGIEWSDGYLDFGLAMIVHEGMVSTYRSVRDLAGKRIAIYDDPAAERWVRDNISNARISAFSGDDGWFEAVENDEADALIYDYPFAAEEIKTHPRTVIVQYNLNQSQYAVGVPAGNFDLRYEINAAIERFRATPAYADLMREYLSSESDVFTRPIEGRRTYTVRAGDTLSRVAGAELMDPARWQEIWDLNRDRVANENLIYPRLVLLMP